MSIAQMQPAAPIPTVKAPAEQPSPARGFSYYRTGTFTSLMVGYMGYYLCRLNFSTAYEPMSHALGMSTETFGLFATVGTAAYAVGKFVSGPAAESLGGRRVFLLGLFGSAAVTLFFGAGFGVGFLIAVWAANRFLQSLGWAGIVNIMPRWFPPNQYGTSMGAITMSYQLGAVVTPLIMGLLLSFDVGWRGLFFGPALMLIALGFILRPFLVQSPLDVGHSLPVDTEAPVEVVPVPLGARLLTLVSRPRFIVALGLSFALTLLRETFGFWMPAYFSMQGASAHVAAFKSAIFPLLGVLGTLFAGWISDRFSSGSRGPVVSAFLAGLALTLLGLANTEVVAQALGLDPSVVALAGVGLAGFFILGPYSMVGGGVVALDFGGRGLAATAAGLLDGVGYAGASLAGVGIAQRIGVGGWAGAFGTLAWITVASLALSLALWRRARQVSSAATAS